MSLLESTKRKIVVAGILGAAVLAGGGTAAYAASAPLSTPSSPTSPTPSAAPHKNHPVWARADHGTFEVHQKGRWITFILDRGDVTAVSALSITLARPDGQSTTIALGPATKYHARVATSASALKTGVGATVVSTGGTATVVVERAKLFSTPKS